MLEVNASPSFGTDSSLDYKIKKNVVGDALRLLNLSYENRVRILKDRKENLQSRILTGKQNKLTPQEREVERKNRLAERFKFESKRMRGYELIYPSADKVRNALYEQMLKKANEMWDEFTTGKNKRKE